jgi:hypothetical protein
VKTANEMSAGTDSNVFISLFGEKGELPNLQLKNSNKKNAFEQDGLDIFTLEKLADIGKVSEFNINLKFNSLFNIFRIVEKNKYRSRWH